MPSSRRVERLLHAPSTVETEVEHKRGRVGYVVSAERLAEDFKDHFHFHKRAPCLWIAVAVLRLQCCEGRLAERVRLEHDEIRDLHCFTLADERVHRTDEG